MILALQRHAVEVAEQAVQREQVPIGRIVTRGAQAMGLVRSWHGSTISREWEATVGT